MKLELIVPNTASAGSEFTYMAIVSNQGPDSADGTRFSLEFEPGISGIRLDCTPTAEAAGASCPSDVTVREGGVLSTSERPSVRGRIATLPVDGRLVFTVRGKFPNTTSASVVFSAELPAGVVDDNPDSNRIQQQTALTTLPASVRVTKTQEKEVTTPGETRVYTVTYENTGNVDAHVSVRDIVRFHKGPHSTESTSIYHSFSYECDTAASTVACPFSMRLTAPWGSGSSSTFWSEEVTIPAGKKFVVKAKLFVDKDTCYATEGDIWVYNKASIHALSNSSFSNGKTVEETELAGRIHLPACSRPAVRVTKTQDKVETRPGEERVYTVTYENTSSIDARVRVTDNTYFYEGSKRIQVPRSYSYECDTTASTMPCPFRFGLPVNTNVDSSVYFWGQTVTIPAGKKFVIKARLHVDATACSASGNVISVDNEAQMRASTNSSFASGKTVETSKIRGTIRVPACSRPSVRVATTQDKALVAVGEEHVYTVTYENTGDIDATVSVRDEAKFYNGSKKGGSLNVEYSSSYICDARASTMPCPLMDFDLDVSHSSYFALFWGGDVTIPVGKKFVMKARLRADERMCDITTGDIYVVNTASATTPNSSFADGKKSQEAEVVTRIRCVDVSTTTALSNYSPKVGERVDVVTQVSNSIGTAADVPFTLQLSTDNRSGEKVNVLTTNAAQDVTCTVESGDAVCPSSFTYDPEANTLTGMIPHLAKGSSLRITVNILLNTAAKYLKTYDVYAETPGIFGDRRLGPEGSNRSSTTFSWSGIVTIPLPNAPADITDPCGLNNAVWVKPEDTYTIRWELNDQGHLLAYPQNGYVFPGGATSHDFGVAADSGDLCQIHALTIPMTGGRSADTIYLAGFFLAVLAVLGAAVKRRHDARVRVSSTRRSMTL